MLNYSGMSHIVAERHDVLCGQTLVRAGSHAKLVERLDKLQYRQFVK